MGEAMGGVEGVGKRRREREVLEGSGGVEKEGR